MFNMSYLRDCSYGQDEKTVEERAGGLADVVAAYNLSIMSREEMEAQAEIDRKYLWLPKNCK